jgi:hypothetical protein
MPADNTAFWLWLQWGEVLKKPIFPERNFIVDMKKNTGAIQFSEK